MFEHVAVAIEPSPGGEAVLKSLPALRALGTRKITLVNVVRLGYPTAGTAEAVESFGQFLEATRARLERDGFEVHGELRTGDPAGEICAAAREAGVSLIVVGSRSHSRVTEMFVGSVAWGVVHGAGIPVLVQRVEPSSTSQEDPPPLEAVSAFDHVIFPTDWSETAERAEGYLLAFARVGRCSSFHLLHVRSQLEEVQTGRSSEQEALRGLQEIADRLRVAGATRVDIESPSGSPFLEIVRRAERIPNSVILMGTHGRSMVADTLLGSVSREVLRRTRSPVILVPRAAA